MLPDQAHVILLQTVVFIKIFPWICSDDNKFMDDNDKLCDDDCQLILYFGYNPLIN